jgi:hypothetical protein
MREFFERRQQHARWERLVDAVVLFEQTVEHRVDIATFVQRFNAILIESFKNQGVQFF